MLHTLTTTPALDITGAAKMWVVAYALWLRRERPECFVGGSYTPVFGHGEHADKLVAYARGRVGADPEIIVAVTRHSVAIGETGWADTYIELPSGSWTDRLTGHTFQNRARTEKLFARLPVALLVR